MNNIIAVIPVDSKELHGIDYTPRANMVHINCEKCKVKCWIGPSQLTLKNQQPELPILCAMCMVNQCNEWEKQGEKVVASIKILAK